MDCYLVGQMESLMVAWKEACLVGLKVVLWVILMVVKTVVWMAVMMVVLMVEKRAKPSVVSTVVLLV
jgi:hypothetical protein